MFQMRTGSQPAYPLPTCPRTCSGSTRPTTSANTGQVNTDPYSQPGMGQEHLSQPSSTGGEFLAMGSPAYLPVPQQHLHTVRVTR